MTDAVFLSNIDKEVRKIAAHQNTASDSITFMNAFPVDLRMKFGMTRQHVAVCSTRRSLVSNWSAGRNRADRVKEEQNNVFHVRIWLVSSALDTVEGRT